jgi:predicted nucleotidyltransferase
MTDDRLEERLREAITAAPAGISSAYLFGSHASGRAHRESDVDVGVLLDRRRYPTSDSRFERRLELFNQLSKAAAGAEIDLVILNDVPPGLGRRIVLDGRQVFCSDPEADHAFRRDVQLRAADLEPFLRRARRRKLAAMAG